MAMSSPSLNTKAAAVLTAAVISWSAAFVAPREGYVSSPRHERVDPPNVYTWCYGRTNYDDPNVPFGKHFTKEECQKLLELSIPKYAGFAQKCIPGLYSLPEPTQVSIISFTYNLGGGTLCKSRVAKSLNLNPPAIRAACEAMMAFVYANGVRLKGLVNRRADERALCLKGLNDVHASL